MESRARDVVYGISMNLKTKHHIRASLDDILIFVVPANATVLTTLSLYVENCLLGKVSRHV